MSDEAGGDSKLVAVPITKMCADYKDVQTTNDLPDMMLQRIAHFFEHYKDLDSGKWVKLDGWGSYEDALAEIKDSVTRYNATSA
jgi:inorganic pyrophosphatase